MTTRRGGLSNPAVVTDGDQDNHSRQVLYIEDNQSQLALLAWIMDREADIELMSAMRGRHGLELAREHVPDLIVLDLHLPDMPGETVLQALQEDVATRRIPVVVLSADDSRKRIKRLLRLGARDYLTKPLDIPRLFESIAANLNPSA